jgi:hypothetical protein
MVLLLLLVVVIVVVIVVVVHQHYDDGSFCRHLGFFSYYHVIFSLEQSLEQSSNYFRAVLDFFGKMHVTLLSSLHFFGNDDSLSA